MSEIYVTTYEVIGDGLPIAEAHFAEIALARATHWRFVESVGGTGFRPSAWDGGLKSVFFDVLPDNWKKIGSDRGKVEAKPRLTSKAGKALATAIADLPKAPQAGKLADQFGYSPSTMAVDGLTGTIYFPTAMELAHPARRMFLRLPRFATDGFEPDPTVLQELPESALMKAVEDHNAEARRLREAGQ